MLVFGVATHYALLLIARYREKPHRHADRHEAMAYVMRRAGPAILASAGTVAIGLLCLLFATMNSTSGMGPVAAAGIVTALLAMTTLLPALVVILGRRIFWPTVPRYDAECLEPQAQNSEHWMWARVSRLVAARRRVMWVAMSAGLLAMTFGLGSLSPADLSAGTGTPVISIANASAADQVRSSAAGTPGPTEVSNQVTAADLVQYDATLSDPADSKAGRQTIDRWRNTIHKVPGAEAKAGGRTATKLGIDPASDHDNKLIIPIVLAVIFLILTVLLRTVVAPLLVIGTVVLSFAAALGASALIFRNVYGFEDAEVMVPLLAFVFLVALGVDCGIFLMHREREESQKPGTQRGLTVTGGVITSAGLVLAGTFTVMAPLPLTFMAELVFVVAFGVLLDTVIVRRLLLPALSHDIGRRILTPGRLARAVDGEDGPAGPDGTGEDPRVLSRTG